MQKRNQNSSIHIRNLLEVQPIYRGAKTALSKTLKTLTIKVKNQQNKHKQKDKVLNIARNKSKTPIR